MSFFTNRRRTGGIIAAVCLLFFSAFSVFVFAYARRSIDPAPPALSAEEQTACRHAAMYIAPPPGCRTGGGTAAPEELLRPLPYAVSPADLPLYARSAIVIDAETGCVLYEKNADEIIPPASMTKIAAMFVIFQDIAAGKIAFSDIVPLPPETWAANAPPGSSLMFLGEGQRVTLEEILLGMAVVSGNDAALAAALYVSGSAGEFCRRMTEEMRALGLTVTTFTEPSGYSELNVTTAREFAAFARIYIQRYPWALEKFHSQRELAYPLAKNMPEGHTGAAGTIVQYATNRLLGSMEGCDGLKTGYIDESGYNLALTVRRDGTRLISVTMGGPGRGSAEGNRYRSADAQTLTDWAFARFKTVRSAKKASVPVPVWKGDTNAVNLTEAWEGTLTAPAAYAQSVTRNLEIPEFIEAPVETAGTYGNAVYVAEDGTVLQTIPLIADRSVERAGPFKTLLDVVAQPLASLLSEK